MPWTAFPAQEGELTPHLRPVRWPSPGHDPGLPTMQPQAWGKRIKFFLVCPWPSGKEKSLERLSRE